MSRYPPKREETYQRAIVLVGSTDPKVLPPDERRDADLILARSGDRRGVLKDRHGAPRRIRIVEWDSLYAAIEGEKRVYEWRDDKLHDRRYV